MQLSPRQIITAAVNGAIGPTYRDHRPGEQRESMLRFPSGLTEVQARAGGCYGLTVIQGLPKLGKSIIAQRASAESARAGWHVIYCHGEMTSGQMDERVSNALGVASPDDWPEWMFERWRAVRWDEEAHIDTLLRREAQSIPPDAERVLIIIDSVQALAEEMAEQRNSERGFYDALNRIKRVTTRIAESSNGRVGVILMSEENKNGGAKGANFENKAQVILKLSRAKSPGTVKIDMLSRDSAGGDLGTHVRDYANCRFMSQSALTPYDLGPEAAEEQEALTGEIPW